MPNGIDLEGMFKAGSRWSTIAWLLSILGFFVTVFATGFADASGHITTGLWISIFYLNITTFILALGASHQLSAIYLAIRGTRDESYFTEKIRSSLNRDDDKEKRQTKQ